MHFGYALKALLLMTVGINFTKTLSVMTTVRTVNLLFLEQYDGSIDSILTFVFPAQHSPVLNLDHEDLSIVSIVSDMMMMLINDHHEDEEWDDGQEEGGDP